MKPTLAYLLGATLLFVGACSGYRYWYGLIEEKSAAVAVLEQRFSENSEIERRIAAARASLAELSGDRDRIQEYFVDENDIVTFINGLEGRGGTLGTKVRVTSLKKEGSGAYPTYSIDLAIEGAFDAVVRTIGAIQYMPAAVSLTTFSLSQKDKGAWGATARLIAWSGAGTPSSPTPAATSTATSSSSR